MRPRIIPALTACEVRALLDDAQAARRDPRDHAAWIIVDALRARGLLPKDEKAAGVVDAGGELHRLKGHGDATSSSHASACPATFAGGADAHA